MVTILVILIPVVALITGFLVLKAVQLGLTWQIQVQNGDKPESPMPKIEIPNPFAAREERRTEQEYHNILDEYLNGPRKEG